MTITRHPATPESAEPSTEAREGWRWARTGTFVLLVAVVVLEVGPSAAGIARDARAIREREADVARAQAAPTEILRWSAEEERLEEALSARLGVSADDAGRGGVGTLSALRLAASEAGVRLVRVEPGGAAPGEGATAKARVEGSGHAIGHFVDEIERGARLGRVRALSIRGPGTREGAPPEATVDVDFVDGP